MLKLKNILDFTAITAFMVGIAVFVSLPHVSMNFKLDESNLRNRVASTAAPPPGEVPEKFVVRGMRSEGTESFVILYCNFSLEVSSIARALSEAPYMSMDVYFLRRDDCAKGDVTTPNSQLRGILVIGHKKGLACLQSHDASGLQPNQDFHNVVLNSLQSHNVNVEMHCEAAYFSNIPLLRDVLSIGQIPFYSGGRIGDVDAVGMYIPFKEAVFRATLHTLRSMNNLNERLHHSVTLWIPLSSLSFVDFQIAQIVPLSQVAAVSLVALGTFLNVHLSLMWLVLQMIFLFCCHLCEYSILSFPLALYSLFQFAESKLVAISLWTAMNIVVLLSSRPSESVLISILWTALILCRSRNIYLRFFLSTLRGIIAALAILNVSDDVHSKTFLLSIATM